MDTEPDVPEYRRRSRAGRKRTTTGRPTHADLLTWADGILAAHGQTPGPNGYDVAALGALAEAHDWGHATEWREDTHVDRRWRATVYRLDAPRAQAWVTGGATGSAQTEGDALAIALARMLARASEHQPQDDER